MKAFPMYHVNKNGDVVFTDNPSSKYEELPHISSGISYEIINLFGIYEFARCMNNLKKEDDCTQAERIKKWIQNNLESDFEFSAYNHPLQTFLLPAFRSYEPFFLGYLFGGNYKKCEVLKTVFISKELIESITIKYDSEKIKQNILRLQNEGVISKFEL